MTIIIIPCSAKKALSPAVLLTAGSIASGSQAWAAESWRRKLVKHDREPKLPARDLYVGRGFGYGRTAADEIGAKLYVISAGLGFVPGDRLVPSYGLSVSPEAKEESVPRRISAEFSPREWWRSVCEGPYSVDPIAELDWTPREELILVALTEPYAKLFAGTLDALKPEHQRRLRIFGRGIADHVPESVRERVLPYEPAVDKAIPGLMLDYPQRALLCFARANLKDPAP